MKYKDVVIMFSSEGAFGEATKTPHTLNIECSMNLYFYCDDVDQLYKTSLEQGALSVMQSNDAFWGDRVC
ncbi:MAG: hypothetical protein HEEMFOPI_01952 [Holosporales bacterium]